MGSAKSVAVVGATGAVGIEMLETLEKRNFTVSSIKLLASARSVGKKLKSGLIGSGKVLIAPQKRFDLL